MRFDEQVGNVCIYSKWIGEVCIINEFQVGLVYVEFFESRFFPTNPTATYFSVRRTVNPGPSLGLGLLAGPSISPRSRYPQKPFQLRFPCTWVDKSGLLCEAQLCSSSQGCAFPVCRITVLQDLPWVASYQELARAESAASPWRLCM